MSTIFCQESVPYLIQSTRFSWFQYGRKGVDKSLTDPRVSEAGRPDLYRRGSHSHVIKHVFDRLDPPEPDDGYPYRLTDLPYHPKSNGFDRYARKPPVKAAEPS